MRVHKAGILLLATLIISLIFMVSAFAQQPMINKFPHQVIEGKIVENLISENKTIIVEANVPSYKKIGKNRPVYQSYDNYLVSSQWRLIPVGRIIDVNIKESSEEDETDLYILTIKVRSGRLQNPNGPVFIIK